MELLKISFKEDKNKKILIFLVVHFLIIGFLLKFVIFPLRKINYEISQKKKEIKNLIAEEKKNAQEIEYFQKKLENSKDVAEKINLALPKEFTLPYLFLSLQTLCATNGMAWENISFGEVSEEKGLPLQKIRISMKVVGKYEDFKKFLDALWKNIPIFDIESIQISPSVEEKSLNLYHYSLELYSYAQAEQKAEAHEKFGKIPWQY